MRVAHVDESTLDALLSNTISPAELGRLKQHVGDCRPCARRVEEWRDLFGEVESIIPTMERPVIAGGALSGSPILIPSVPASQPAFDLTRVLLPAGVVLALAAAAFAYWLHRSAGGGVAAESEQSLPLALSEAPVPVAVTQSDSRSLPIATRPVSRPAERARPVRPIQDSQPNSTPAVPPPNASSSQESPVVPASPPGVTTAVAPLASQAARPFTESAPPTPPNPMGSRFHRIEMPEAIRLLSGSIQLVDGLTPDHLEAGPGALVPGARPDADVVRVVYVDSGHRRILLDQQRVDPDPATAPADTLIVAAPNGIALARWTDAHGFWLSLAGVFTSDSARVLVDRVK